MQVTVNANRMILMKITRRLAMAHRGHKLLKQKLDELINLQQSANKKFIDVKQAVNEALKQIYSLFILGGGLVRGDYLTVLLSSPVIKTELNKELEMMLNFRVPKFSIDCKLEKPPFSFLDTNSELDNVVRKINETIKHLLQLAQYQRQVEVLSKEIEITRRRVNALEYILIPSFENSVRFIQMRLDENERADINRLMRIKSVINKNK